MSTSAIKVAIALAYVVFAVLLNSVGTVILQALNHYVTILTDHHGMVLGTIILVFVLGLRRGLADWVYAWAAARRVRIAQPQNAARDKLA